MAQLSCFSFFRFMEAAAAPQGATTMVPRARSPTEAPASHARGLGALGQSGAAGKTGARRARQEAAAREGAPGPPRLPLSLPQPPPDPCRSPCRRPPPAPGCPQPAGGAEAQERRGRPGLPRGPAPARRARRCGGARGGQSPMPGDPRRAVPWSFIHKKGPTTLLGRRLRPFIGRGGVMSQRGDLSTGRYLMTP